MRITTRKTIDMITGVVLEHEYFEYDGEIMYFKGEKSEAEQKNADAITASQLALQQKSFDLEQKQMSDVNAAVDPMIANGGMSPAQQAAMTSLLTNNLGNSFRTGMGAVNASLAARGIVGGQAGAGAGGAAGQFGAMQAALGGMQQQGLSQIELAKQQQLFQELGLKMGIGSQFGSNVGQFGQGASSALSGAITAANNADQAGTSFWGPVIGAGLGTAGSVYQGKGCWIAREIYGEESPYAEFARMRLYAKAEKEFRFKVITTVYEMVGQRVSLMVRKWAWLRKMFTAIFNKFIIDQIDEALNEAIR